MGHSWYLMVDMQLYWVTPLLLLPLWRWPRLGVCCTLLATAASCAVPFAVAWTQKIRAHVPLDFTCVSHTQLIKIIKIQNHGRVMHLREQ